MLDVAGLIAAPSLALRSEEEAAHLVAVTALLLAGREVAVRIAALRGGVRRWRRLVKEVWAGMGAECVQVGWQEQEGGRGRRPIPAVYAERRTRPRAARRRRQSRPG